SDGGIAALIRGWVNEPRAKPKIFVEVEPARSPPCTPAGTFTFTFGHTIERRMSRRPAACSRFAFACRIAGFLSSVVFRTPSRVIPGAVCKIDNYKIAVANFVFIDMLIFRSV